MMAINDCFGILGRTTRFTVGDGRSSYWWYGVWTLLFSLLFCQTQGYRRRLPDIDPVPLEPVILNTTPTNYSFIAGETAVLNCPVVNLGTKTVTWRKAYPSVPLTVGLFTYYGDTRMQAHHVIHKGQWNLHIRNVSINDSGAYECQVSTKTRTSEGVFSTVKEQKSSILITGDRYVNKYKRLVLLCNASSDSYPPDELDWFLNGHKVVTDLDDGIKITNSVSLKSRAIWSELVIEHARMKHGGTYICRTSEKLVTNIKVNILSDDRFQVKRGTSSGKLESPVSGFGGKSAPSLASGAWTFLVWCTFVAYVT
uniref:Kin of IRRE-like protein 1 n=1 Tax=Crassostrea virginica TaxID=6565 RepID=A0A8B8DN27_CRAVI|nr:kin of IRRE-like protein 1 [Crassostrea virginica]